MTRGSHHRVAAAALISEGRVLLCRRRSDLDWYPGVWDLVGGHLEEDESSEQAVIRECGEELGIRVTALALLASETSADADIDVFTVSAWVGEPTNRAPQEHTEIAWFSAEELPRLDLSDRRLVPHLLDLVEGVASKEHSMHTVELAAGPIDYVDTGGAGPILVLTHGFPMNHLQWRKVVPLLGDVRCVLPTLPLGAHRKPMNPGADLSQGGQAMILADFLEALDLSEVTLVMNDWGAPQFIVALGRADRVGRMVFVACEAFDNFAPPQARPVVGLARMPGGIWLLMQLLRTSFFRHDPRTWGGVSRSRIPDDVLDEWFTPALRDRDIRRDLRTFALGTPPRETLLAWSDALGTFDRPALVVWAENDAVMPREHGRRLADLLPQGRLIEIADSGTLIPEDQPEQLAQALREFIGEDWVLP